MNPYDKRKKEALNFELNVIFDYVENICLFQCKIKHSSPSEH